MTGGDVCLFQSNTTELSFKKTAHNDNIHDMHEKRRSRRKNLGVKGEIILDDIAVSGKIENISEHGIYVEISSDDPLSTSSRFVQGTELRVHFDRPSGEILKLHCRVIWSYKAEPQGMTEKIGMEVIFPPPGFLELYYELT